MMPDVFSPIEVFRDIVAQVVDSDVVPTVVVGPMSEEQQEAGGASLMDAGEAKVADQWAVYPRFQIRCIAPQLAQVERIGQHVGLQLNGIRRRMVGAQTSTGREYLVHGVIVNGGPSAHQDTPETWEYLLFAEAMIGIDPVS